MKFFTRWLLFFVQGGKSICPEGEGVTTMVVTKKHCKKIAAAKLPVNEV
jgi:hypothetical protein